MSIVTRQATTSMEKRLANLLAALINDGGLARVGEERIFTARGIEAIRRALDYERHLGDVRSRRAREGRRQQ